LRNLRWMAPVAAELLGLPVPIEVTGAVEAVLTNLEPSKRWKPKMFLSDLRRSVKKRPIRAPSR
jgi:hypothetical protein